MNLPPPNPLGIPDTPEQAMSDFLFSTAISGGAMGLAWVITGSYPGPGPVGTVMRAFFSPAHVGASYAGASALDDTLFALRVYSEPFRLAARVLGPIGMGITAMQVGRALGGTKDISSDYHRHTSDRIARARDMASR